MRARRIIAGLALLVLTGDYGCGGGGGSSSGGGGGANMGGIMWPMRDGGESSALPPSVKIGRIVFESQSGESCCVAVTPMNLSARRGLAILINLPVGPATVTVAGFSTDFAPTVPGIMAMCETSLPENDVKMCDMAQVATPAFESPPLAVTILADVQTDLPEVPIVALPFLFDYSPPQDSMVNPPFDFAFTVVDAVAGIRAESVALDVSFQVPTQEPPSFRTVTKRVHLDLNTCDDSSPALCSKTGALQLSGFKAAGTAPELPEGQVEARITAENLADPARDLDFRYSFNVLATATATATDTPVVGTPVAAESPGESAPTIGERPTAAVAPTAVVPPPLPRDSQAPVATPTATPRPGEQQ